VHPLILSLRNVRTFADLDLKLPQGCSAIVGPNGAGKSSLLSALDVALFADRGELASLLTKGEEHLEISLTFEHGGELYRVRRQYDGRGRGKSLLDFERASRLVNGWDFVTDGGWEPLTLESAGATQTLISQTLGLTRSTFRASAFLCQGHDDNYPSFVDAGATRRKEILGDVIGLGVWDALRDRAKGERKQGEGEKIALRTRAESLQETVDKRPLAECALGLARVDEENSLFLLGDAERVLTEAREALAAQQVARERLTAAEREREAALQALTRATRDVEEAQRAALLRDQTAERLQADAAQAARAPGLEQRVSELREQSERAREARRVRDELQRQIDQRHAERLRRLAEGAGMIERSSALLDRAGYVLEHVSEEHCDRCGQVLGAEAARRAAASYVADANLLELTANEVKAWAETEGEEIDALRADLVSLEVPAHVDPALLTAAAQDASDARDAALRHATLVEQHRQLAERADTLPVAQAEREVASAAEFEARMAAAKARESVGDTEALTSAASAASERVATHRATLDEARVRIAREQVVIDQAQEAEQQLAEVVTQAGEIAERVDLLALAERAFGRDGIPALILENSAIPAIEMEANRILRELGTPFHVTLQTQREQKTVDHLRETLDVVVSDGMFERPYETFSGGERTRINLALRIALARLLANRRGAESRLLAIDEPDGLDADGMQRLAELLRGMGDTFSTVLVVSHNAELSSAFDQTIAVRREGERSTINGVAEKVPA
jgi:exonuclease SbcC